MNDMFGPLFALLALVTIAGILIISTNNVDKAAAPESEKFNVICLDGVEYWYRHVGYRGVMAVKLDTDGNVQICQE